VSVRIIRGLRSIGGTPPSAALYDSVTGWAFGPVFAGEAEAESFLACCAEDPRTYSEVALRDIHEQWSRWWVQVADDAEDWPPADVTPQFVPGVRA